jgi:hypothetical protein
MLPDNKNRKWTDKKNRKWTDNGKRKWTADQLSSKTITQSGF